MTLAQLDAKLVRTLELGDEAALFHQAAVAAGLRPPARFGTEVVARLLGLRTNHPAGQDDLERPAERPGSPCGGRLLRRADPAPVRVGDDERGRGRGELRAARLHALAAPRASRPRSASSATPTCGAESSSAQSHRSARRPRAASTAPASPGASTASSRIPEPRSLRPSSAAAPPPTWPARSRVDSGSRPRGWPRPTSSSSAPAGGGRSRADRPHGPLPRERLADPLVALRRRSRAARRLVRRPARVGPPPARRSRTLGTGRRFRTETGSPEWVITPAFSTGNNRAVRNPQLEESDRARVETACHRLVLVLIFIAVVMGLLEDPGPLNWGG